MSGTFPVVSLSARVRAGWVAVAPARAPASQPHWASGTAIAKRAEAQEGIGTAATHPETAAAASVGNVRAELSGNRRGQAPEGAARPRAIRRRVRLGNRFFGGFGGGPSMKRLERRLICGGIFENASTPREQFLCYDSFVNNVFEEFLL